MNQKGFVSIVLIVLAVIFAGAVGYFALLKSTTEPITSPVGNNVQSTQRQVVPPSENTTTMTDKRDSSKLQIELKVGDQIKLSDSPIVVTINKIEFSQGGQLKKPAEGNEWINLNLTDENTSSIQQYSTALGQEYITDNKGNKYEMAITDRVAEDRSFSFGVFKLGGESNQTGWIGFEIKQGATGLKFHYDRRIFGGKEVLVNLGR